MKQVYVEMREGGGARIHVNPMVIDPRWLLNPDRSGVEKVSPSFWKLVDGKLTPMTQAERDAVGGAVYAPKVPEVRVPDSWLLRAAWVAGGTSVGYFIAQWIGG
jgi:hypothetical protein